MPYNIRKSGNDYCVYKDDGSKVGCSPTRAKATAHMRALYANEGKSASNSSIEPSQAVTQATPIGNSLQRMDFEVEVDRDQDGNPIYAKASAMGLRPREVEMPPLPEATATIEHVTPLPPQITVAPGVAGKVVHAANAEAAYVGGYEVMEHQLDPRVVEYNPVGGMAGGKACANCQWFVSPNACILVRGEISPTGISALWKQEAEEPALASTPVEIVAVSEGVKFVTSELVSVASEPTIAQRAIDFANGIFGVKPGGVAPSVEPGAPITLYKIKSIDSDGVETSQLRFVAQWTNQFEDRGAQIIPEVAHMRMLEWARGINGEDSHYPVLVNWHALGTEYGQVDCMDYNDGFVVAFGYIMPGREDIAYKVAAKKDTGMSHGSIYRTDTITGEIIEYWPFEISDLPRKFAKNSWTEWRLAEMAFSDETKKYLASVGHTPEQITASEATTSAFAAQLKELGIAFKDDQVPDTAGLLDVITHLGTKLGEVTTALEATNTKLAEMEPKVEAANASLDAAVAAAIKPQGTQQAAIHAATKSDDNVEGSGSGTPAVNGGGWNAKSFHTTVFGSMRKPVSEQ